MPLVRVCAITYDEYPFDILVRRMAEAAIDAGYASHVICVMSEGQKKHEICNGVHVHRVSMRRIIGGSLGVMVLSWLLFTILAMGKVIPLYFKYRYNIIHVHNMPDFLVFSSLIPKLFGSQVILEVQDVCPELTAAKVKGQLRYIIFTLAVWQERISTAFTHHIITVGWPFEEILLKRGVPQKKLTSILNSADPKLFPQERCTEPWTGQATAEHPVILMYHGTLAERNGLDIAIRAFAKARQTAPYLHLHIKGLGEALNTLKQLVQELEISDAVTFFAPSASDELVDFIAMGDIGIIPYRSDGFMDLVLPTKAYEFAWMRRPMIASTTLAIRSMFRPGSLILCEPSNVDSFAEAIVDLYQHPQKRIQLIANAEQDYVSYRWEKMAERYQQLLASLAAKVDKKNSGSARSKK